MNEVISYLNYLRDVSRKIISRSGFEQVLLDKSKKNPFFAVKIKENLTSISYNDSLYKHFTEILKHIDRNPDKQLFIGFGFICGKWDDRTYAGPLVFTECDISSGQEITIDVDFNSLTLNYDLISSLLGSLNIGEDEEYSANLEDEISLVDKIEKIISDIYTEENNILHKIQNYCQTLAIPEPRGTTTQIIFKFTVEFSKKIFSEIKILFQKFNDIDIGKDFDFNIQVQNHREQNDSIFDQNLKFYNTTFYFVNVIPDELSTFIALKKLSNEITEQNFENPTLKKLLLNSLTNSREKLTKVVNEKIYEIINNQIPLNLSKTQKRAIKNAFEYELSYIQGPPGTGKSYTISAIILTALFLGKKVLLISQKKPALEVVKEKTEPFFSDYSENINGLIYYDINARKEIRRQISKLLNECRNLDDLERELNSIRNNITKKTKDLDSHILEIKDLEEKLHQTLDNEYDFKSENDCFIKYVNEVFSKNYHPLDNNHKFTFISTNSKIDFILDQLSKFYSLPYKNAAIKLYEKKITNLLIDKFHLNIDLLLDDFPGYAEAILKLNKYFSKTRIKRSKIKYSCDKLRNEISYHKSILEDFQKEILHQKFKLNLFSLLMDEDYKKELENFSKMLNFTKASEIQSRMKGIDFNKIIDLFPFWAAEIRHLGRLFPMKPDLFDLVVVDEASQVNLAEVLPAFYRGKNICIVGDHKQLNVRSTGIGFQLSKRFDVLTWQRHNADYLNYASAKSKNLTVTDASILDFIMSEYNNIIPPSVMLDEHFRSLPQLANFTNTFYKDLGGLKIMTETCEKVHTKSFICIKIDGKRNEKKEIKEEANKVIEVIKIITSTNRHLDFQDTLELPEQLQGKILSIGIITMLRNQCNLIQSLIDKYFVSEIIDKHKIMVGTPEEFQGNERDIMIFSLGLDENCRHSIGHYQNAQRLNVATSRARLLTIFVYSSIPNNFNRIISYLKYFKGELDTDDIQESEENIVPSSFSNWSLDINAYESDFERKVYFYLDKYIKQKTDSIRIYNQVKSCGQKRLDFVLYNEENKKSVAVEVDGSYHFIDNQYGKSYSQEHIERIETLTRAGWKIINTPYYKWYNSGWLCDENNEIFREELKRIYSELDKYLL